MHEMSRRAVLGGGLAVAATAALSGCRSSKDPGATQSRNAAVQLPTYVKYEGVTPDYKGNAVLNDGFKKFPESLVKGVEQAPGDGKPISFMTNIPGALPPGKDQNKFWQELNTQLGSDLEISMATNDEYPTKFQTRVASGDLPDIVNVPVGTARMPELLAASCVDLTEHLAGDAVKKYPFLANLSEDYWRGCVFNGGIYGVPVPRLMSRTSSALCRLDLLEEKGIGKPEPASFDESMQLWKDVTDPKSNVWAWTRVPQTYILGMLGIDNGWHEEGGKFTHWREHAEYKRALEAMQQMVKEGVVNPDSFTANATTRKQWFNGGRAIFDYDSFVAWNQYYAENSAGDAFSVDMLDVPAFDSGVEAKPWLGAALNNVTSFKKDSEHEVETLLAVANWMAAPFGTEEYLFRKYGTAGEHYELNGTDPVPKKEGVVQTGIGLQYISDSPLALYYAGKPEVAERQHAIQKAMEPRLSRDASQGLYSETAYGDGKTADKEFDDGVNQIIQGNKPVSDYDALLSTWKQTGDKVRSEFEQAFAAANGG
ncbi:extracellular solute-binding protein [Propionibacteriaceae bacterium Y1700]|uniref:substrate-binding domain-containing protein n=1 Tax=Microlunatus sp. Y1700 TaxID=3418487 RepID=UPI003DA70E7D